MANTLTLLGPGEEGRTLTGPGEEGHFFPRVITHDIYVRNSKFSMKVAQIMEVKKSCSKYNGCHGYLITSSQSAIKERNL